MQDYAAREWVKEGAIPEKMLIGMPTYGRTFTLTDPAEYDIGAAVEGGGKPARFTREEGFASYYEVRASNLLQYELRESRIGREEGRNTRIRQ